jgi:hypothetical protein
MAINQFEAWVVQKMYMNSTLLKDVSFLPEHAYVTAFLYIYECICVFVF